MFYARPFCRPLFSAVLVAAGLIAAAAPSRAAEADARLEVHDLSFWIVDPGAKTANARTAFPSALPVTVNSVRAGDASLASRRAAPINLLTFHGPAASDLDVDLRSNAGSFLAHWPPGENLPNRLRWSGTPPYNLAEKIDDETQLLFVDDDHWFVKARQGDALYVKRGARSERFLAYDLELKLDAPLRLEGGPDKFTVINLSDRPVYDVLIARRTGAGCRVAWIDVVPPGAPAPAGPQGANVPQAPGDPPADALRKIEIAEMKIARDAGVGNAETQAAKARILAQLAAEKARLANARAQQAPPPQPVPQDVAAPAAAAPAAPPGAAPPAGVFVPLTKPSPAAPPKPQEAKPVGGLFGGIAPAKPSPGIEVTLSEPLAADSPEAAAQTSRALAHRLTKAGLAPYEVELFLDHYGSLFFDDQELVVACRLDPAVIEEKVPLSVFPAPARTVRVAMVLVRNADPQLGDEVAQLVARLGDAKYAVREAAHKRLVELGPLAFPALNQALNNSDLEIVIRAERILLQQQQTPAAQGAAVQNGVLQIQAGPVIINR